MRLRSRFGTSGCRCQGGPKLRYPSAASGLKGSIASGPRPDTCTHSCQNYCKSAHFIQPAKRGGDPKASIWRDCVRQDPAMIQLHYGVIKAGFGVIKDCVLR